MLARLNDLGALERARRAPLPRAPFTMFGSLHREMERLLGDFEQNFGEPIAFGGPRFELEEKEGAFVLTAELPGFSEADVSVELKENQLTVRGERSDATVGDGEKTPSTRRSQKFSRTFTIGAGVDAAKTDAAMKHGVLTLTIPKVPEPQAKKIEVKS